MTRRGSHPNAEAVLRYVAGESGSPLRFGHKPSTWLRRHLVELTSPIVTCGHAGATFGATWDPMIVCLDCLDVHDTFGAERYTCDRCRQVSPPIEVSMIAYGEIVCSIGLCGSCSVKEYGP